MTGCWWNRLGFLIPDEFFDILRDEPLDQWYEIGNIIALVDAAAPGPESPEAEYLLASEAAPAGLVILSHGDEVPKEQAEAVVEHLNRALEKIRCPRRFGDDVLEKGNPVPFGKGSGIRCIFLRLSNRKL